MLFTGARTTFATHVFAIVSAVAKEEMIGVDADRRVATVQNALIVANRPFVQLIGYSVRSILLSSVVQATIAVPFLGVLHTKPDKASRIRFGHVPALEGGNYAHAQYPASATSTASGSAAIEAMKSTP